jgi:hypothetical protein
VSDAAETPSVPPVGEMTLAAALAIDFHRPQSPAEWQRLGEALRSPAAAGNRDCAETA